MGIGGMVLTGWAVYVIGAVGWQTYNDYVLKCPDTKFGPCWGSLWHWHLASIIFAPLLLPLAWLMGLYISLTERKEG